MKRLLLILILLPVCAAQNADAQGWEWASSAGNIDNWLVNTDVYGNTYVGGVWQTDSILINSTTYYNHHTGPNNYETVIAKYDSSGNIHWSCASTLGQAWPISLTTDSSGH